MEINVFTIGELIILPAIVIFPAGRHLSCIDRLIGMSNVWINMDKFIVGQTYIYIMQAYNCDE